MSSPENSVGRYRAGFLVLLCAAVVFRMWFMTSLPLSGDEAYHWEWSRHLAPGYYDHPPLTAYAIRLSTFIFGKSTEFTVRLPALLFLTVTAITACLLARLASRKSGYPEAAAEKAGFIAGLLVVMTPLYTVFSMYMSTDPPLICFSMLSLYFFYRAFTCGDWTSWLCAGASLGLALLSKFLAFLVVPGLVLFVLVSREDRAWLKRPHAYVAGLVALAILAPFLWWNYSNDWATFRFNFMTRHEGNAFSWKYLPEYIGGQALVISPVMFLAAVYAVWRGLKNGFAARERTSLYMALCAAAPLLYFLFVSLRRRVGLHWPEAGWLPILVLLAVWWAGEGEGVAGFLKKIRKTAIWSCVVLSVALYPAVHTPPAWLTFDWKYPGAPDRINIAKNGERFGWREMGNRVGNVRDSIAAEQTRIKRGVFLMTGQYGMTAAVSFYVPGQSRAYLWAGKRAHGENYRFWDDFRLLKDSDAVYVAKTLEQAEKVKKGLEKHFEYVDKPDKLPILVDGREVRSFYLMRCFIYDGIPPVLADDGEEISSRPSKK